MVWDFAFGKTCDHRVLEEVNLIVEVPSIRVELDNVFDQNSAGFTLLKNGVNITDQATFSFDPAKEKTVYITGLVVNTAAYPLDDYEIGYTAPPDQCPKCYRRSL